MRADNQPRASGFKPIHDLHKVYIFGSIVCIRQAIVLGKLSNYADLVPDDVIIREICMIFENESLKGDDICFNLFDANPDDTHRVACFNGDTRLCHG